MQMLRRSLRCLRPLIGVLVAMQLVRFGTLAYSTPKLEVRSRAFPSITNIAFEILYTNTISKQKSYEIQSILTLSPVILTIQCSISNKTVKSIIYSQKANSMREAHVIA